MHLGFWWLWKTNPVFQLCHRQRFTINDSLKKLNIDLKLQPFMEGRQQLLAEQVSDGGKIALLRIHIKSYRKNNILSHITCSIVHHYGSYH